MKNKNNYQHNDDGTTHIFVESKHKHYPGKYTIIFDTEDWDRVKEHKWSVTRWRGRATAYARATIPHPDGGWRRHASHGRQKRTTSLSLHRLIAGQPSRGKAWDHINRNGLDNRKENLREATAAQNAQNSKSQRNTTSHYKGVCRRARRPNRWCAAIRHQGKAYHIGYFACEHEAALAYNKRAIELGWEHALLNNVDKV